VRKDEERECVMVIDKMERKKVYKVMEDLPTWWKNMDIWSGWMDRKAYIKSDKTVEQLEATEGAAFRQERAWRRRNTLYFQLGWLCSILEPSGECGWEG
jgi:hypothetical protein